MYVYIYIYIYIYIYTTTKLNKRCLKASFNVTTRNYFESLPQINGTNFPLIYE